MGDSLREPERRGPLSQEYLQLLIERVVDKNLETAEDRLKDHVDSKIEEIKDLLKSALPDGDVHAHLLAHKQMMKLSVDRAERWGKVWDRLLVGATYSITAAIVLALWDAFKASIHK